MPRHVFISYSRSDRAYVDELAAHLKGAGAQVWYDHGLVAGDRFAAVIQEMIEQASAFVVVLSPASVQSRWVDLELSYAHKQGLPIHPLMLAEVELPFVIHNRHVESVVGGRLPGDGLLAALGLAGPALEPAERKPVAPRRPIPAAPSATPPTPRRSRRMLGEEQLFRVLDAGGYSGWQGRAAFSPDGSRLAVNCDRRVLVWDVTTGTLETKTPSQDVEIRKFAFSPDGSLLVTTGDSGTVRLWDLPSGVLRRTFRSEARTSFADAAFSPGGRLAIVDGSNVLRIHDIASGEDRLLKHSHYMAELLFVTDRWLLTSAWTPSIPVWDVEAGSIAYSYAVAGSYAAQGLRMSPDARLLAGVLPKRSPQLWDLRSGQTRFELSEHARSVKEVALSPDGSRLVGRDGTGTLRVWDTADGQYLYAYAGHGDEVSSLMFSPDGRQLATASEDHTVRVWDTDSRQTVHIFGDRESLVSRAVFSPDGQMLATPYHDGSVRLWHV
ncbi:toll/interleukin-1 receptor domain-containing protein [Catellatospora tritici]|uniref:toll/interleukin-1 receptor domain-containing protein n=1 Tax=Catellatospora tritici TaxID=2851566 RepID=UPI001C2D487D|nr:TIR domain-containing protein [Catellatospora tritici]MBV1855848.1 TIR domain-containing protein [Catellatospora tritici]